MRKTAVARTRTKRSDGLPIPRRYWSAAAIWLALAMAVLDASIANVALPTIAAEMGSSPGTSIWVINAYQLAITVLLLPLSALGERLGYRRIYIPGLVLFTIGSVTCAVAHSLTELILARIFQGVGAAAIMSLNAALVRATYPSSILGRGIGYNALVLAVSAAAGPTIAALILSVGSWRWLFLVNLPVGIAAVVIGLRALPATRVRGSPFDWLAAVLSAVMLGGMVYGAEQWARDGTPAGLPFVLAGVIAGVILVRREWSVPMPLVPLDLLRIPMFSLSVVTSVISFAAQMLAFVTLPFLFQSVFGRSAFETGLLMTPWPLAVALSAPYAGRLADRMSAGLLGGVGLAVFALGLFLLSQLGDGPGTLDIAWRMAVCGLGFGFFVSPNNRAIVSSAPEPRSGAAGGMLASARLLGQTAGAVGVAAAFHLAGVAVSPEILQTAALIAALAAAISLLRRHAGEQPKHRGHAPILD